jgi:hypothetical protein
MATPEKRPSILSDRAYESIGAFAQLVRALDQGRLREATQQQRDLRRLGFAVDVRPLRDPHRRGGVR